MYGLVMPIKCTIIRQIPHSSLSKLTTDVVMLERTHNAGVEGSSPSLSTIKSST
jgi:hypothetical protein